MAHEVVARTVRDSTTEPAAVAGPFRFAPARPGVNEPACFLWKLWTAGSEIYFSNRHGGHLYKFSIHQSGEIHMKTGSTRNHQLMTPPQPTHSASWMHAFELRFLLPSDALRPTPEDVGTKSAFLIEVPDSTALAVHIVVGTSIARADEPAPTAHPGDVVFWRNSLRDGRPVVLLAKLYAMNEENEQHLSQVRKRNPLVTYSRQPRRRPYLEARDVYWLPQGNLAVCVPLGPDSYAVRDNAVETSR